MSWYVLRCRFGYEELIAKTVASWALPPDDGSFESPLPYRSFCPVNEVRWRVRGIEHVRRVPLFATYVFLDWRPPVDDAEAWHRVIDLDGAERFIGGEFPTAVREEDLAEHMDRTDTNGVVQGIEALIQKLRRGFGAGDTVRIEGGSWDGQQGICNWCNEKGINLTLSVFGRPQEVFLSDYQARFKLEETAPPVPKPRRDRGYLVNLARGAGA